MNYLNRLGVVILGSLPVAIQAGSPDQNHNASCYTAYHLQQQLDLTMNFGSITQQQKTDVDIDFHIREIAVADSTLSLLKNRGATKNVRSYVGLLLPNESKVNGAFVDISQRYSHPFLVLVDDDTGELIDLKSTTQERDILKEYLSFYDLFQYSEQPGEYQYKNGNGRYQAQITTAVDKPGVVSRKNRGYLATSGKNQPQVVESDYSFSVSDSSSECFYQKGRGTEAFSTVLAAKSIIDGDASITIEADSKRALSPDHYFFRLGHNLEFWPTVSEAEPLTSEEAFAKLPFLMATLSSLTEDKSQFVSVMLENEALWPHLAEYILENGISNEVSLKLFGALNRIDTTASVNALALLATSPLSERELFRAVMALGSTTSSFKQDELEQLNSHFMDAIIRDESQTEDFTFIRMYGAMAQKRDSNDPLQRMEMRSFLYAQSGNYSDAGNAAVMDAIGNLRESVDREGEDLLLRGLKEEATVVRHSAASAFKRIPYKAEYSRVFIDQLANERNTKVIQTIIEVLGNSENSDLEVKHQLLSVLNRSNNNKLKNRSLGSLVKINYSFQQEEVELLETNLRKESNNANQRLFASLILKHRRQQ